MTGPGPAWVADAVWWQVYPLGFLGAEPTSVEAQGTTHRLRRLEPWLDHLVSLGANGLALGPIFASETHGYDTVDHLRIDPRLGDEDDLAHLVDAARAKGVRLLLDGVFNHVGRGFAAFQDALAHGPDAEGARWFHLRWPEEGGEPSYRDFEGHHQLVALDHDEPAVADHVVEVMCHWLDAGADGWRLDAAYAVDPAFWARVLPRVRARHPDAYIVGEVIHGDYADVVTRSGMDAVTQYELWKAIWSSLNDRNLFELAWALDRHDGCLATFAPLTFVGNHDVTRLASRLVDHRHLAHALVVLLTVGGTPSIYYGDEEGLTGAKEDRVGGDDAVRPPYPDDPGGLDPAGGPVRRLHQELIGLRRRHRWLHQAATRSVHLTNEQLVYAVSDGDDHLLVMLNLADDPVEVPAPDAGRVLAGDADLVDPGRARLTAHGWAVAG